MISNRGQRATVAVVLFASWLASTACSFATVRGPPAGHERLTYVTCQSSYQLPAIDLVFGALMLPLGALGIVSGALAIPKVMNCRRAIQGRDAAYSAFLATPSALRADASIVAVKVSPVDTLRIGQMLEPRAAAVNEQGIEIPGRMFQWASSDTAVLSMFGSTVRAKTSGMALLTATTGGVTGSLPVVVVP